MRFVEPWGPAAGEHDVELRRLERAQLLSPKYGSELGLCENNRAIELFWQDQADQAAQRNKETLSLAHTHIVSPGLC